MIRLIEILVYVTVDERRRMQTTTKGNRKKNDEVPFADYQFD